MTRKPMPSERKSITKKLKIGDLEGYVTCGLYEDGSPGELFITLHQVGSVERGLAHALALMISLALQRGVPVADIGAKLVGLKFEPDGFTGKADIPHVHSVADYIGQWLRLKFVKEEK